MEPNLFWISRIVLECRCIKRSWVARLFGVSIYQRLLNNPGKFRLERQLYDGCANGYCGLMILIVSRIGEQVEKKHRRLIHEGFEFIVDTIKILEKYLSKHQNEKVRESLDFFYSIKKEQQIASRKTTYQKVPLIHVQLN